MIDKENIKNSAMIEHLVLQGAIEISGIDQTTGDMLYSITDKLKEVHPKLYKELKGDFERHMFELIDQGPKVMQWRLTI
jgi:hypothetical protein